MTLDPLRSLRLKLQAASNPESDRNRRRDDELETLSPRGTPRFVGRVVTGASDPVYLNRVFLVNPVRVDGVEQEAAPGAVVVDADRSIPVVIAGVRPPLTGEVVVAYAIQGRWVAALSDIPPANSP